MNPKMKHFPAAPIRIRVLQEKREDTLAARMEQCGTPRRTNVESQKLKVDGASSESWGRRAAERSSASLYSSREGVGFGQAEIVRTQAEARLRAGEAATLPVGVATDATGGIVEGEASRFQENGGAGISFAWIHDVLPGGTPRQIV